MSQQDSTNIKTDFILITEQGHFLRGFCGLGRPEFTKKSEFAKRYTAEEAVKKSLELRNQGYIIFVDNLNKYLPLTEV